MHGRCEIDHSPESREQEEGGEREEGQQAKRRGEGDGRKRTPNRPAWEYMTNFGASSAPSRDPESSASLVSYPSLPHHLDGLPRLFSLPCM